MATRKKSSGKSSGGKKKSGKTAKDTKKPAGAAAKSQSAEGGTGPDVTSGKVVDSAGKEAKDGGRLPLFYKRPVALSPSNFEGRGLAEEPDYRFAKETNSVPVTATEFGRAACHYPIVFSPGDPPVPIVVLGLRNGKNIFVDDKGYWRAHHYIPMYVRRYPFVFVAAQENDEYVLCVDEASSMVKKDGQPFFDKDGKATELLNRALEFCKTYQTQHQVTRRMIDAVAEAELLVPHRADVVLESGERMGLTGFRVIDEEKFHNLDDATFLKWRKSGWLGPIYLHLASQANWTTLVRHMEQSEGVKAK